MSKYVKEIKKYVFSSDLVKGKAYHIINNIKANDDMNEEDETSAITKMPHEFDAIFSFIDDIGDAIFLTLRADGKICEWINIKADDVASDAVKIIELIQSFASIYKIEKPNLDPEYVRRMLNDIENGGGQSLLTINNIINQAINNLEEAHIHEEDLDNAYKDMYGVIHQPSVTEKEAFFIETDPNIHPV